MEELKKLLVEAGFNDTDFETIKKALIDSKYVPDFCVPRTRLNEEIEKKKALEEQVGGFTKTIDELKKGAGDNEELKKQIDSLKGDLKKSQQEYDDKMKAFYKENSIKSEFANDVYDSDYIYSKLDLSKIVYDENSKKAVAGLKEQLDALKADERFKMHFKNNVNTGVAGGFMPQPGKQPDPQPQPGEKSQADKNMETYLSRFKKQ